MQRRILHTPPRAASCLAVLLVVVSILIGSTRPGSATFRPAVTLTSAGAPFGVTIREEWSNETLRNEAAAAGVKWARASVLWSQIEPTRDSYGNLGWLDQQVGWFQSLGITPIYYITGNPSWAASTTCGVIDLVPMSEFATMIGMLAERYDGDDDYDGDGDSDGPAQGRIDYWSLYNEPDNKWPQYTNFGGCWGQHGTQYAQLLRLSWAAVHTANPNAQLGIGGLGSEPNPICQLSGCVGEQIFNTNIVAGIDNSTPNPSLPADFVDDILNYIVANPGNATFDYIDFHSYPAFANNWDANAPYHNAFYGKAKHYTLRMQNKLGASSRYVLSTETGRPSNPAKVYFGVPGSDEEQSRQVVRLYAQALRFGIRAALWFSHYDFDSDLWGLRGAPSSYTPKPAFTAYQTLTSVLTGSTFITKPTSIAGAELYVFDTPVYGIVSIVWATSASGTVNVTFLGSTLIAADKFGNMTTYYDGQSGDKGPAGDGKIILAVGESPIYVGAIPEAAGALPATATATATRTPTRTQTATPSQTPSRTATATGTATQTPTCTATATQTATPTQTPSHTTTATQTASPTPTQTATATPTSTQPPATAIVPLAAGWNLISLPLAPADPAVLKALASISGTYDLVYAYDAFNAADPWKTYSISRPPAFNDLQVITESMGVWISIASPVTLVVTGTAPVAPSINLAPGWNLVGYPSDVTRPVTVALASCTGAYDVVNAYDAFDTTDPWKTYNTARPAALNDLKDMEPGKGYWINATQPCTWLVP